MLKVLKKFSGERRPLPSHLAVGGIGLTLATVPLSTPQCGFGQGCYQYW